MLLNLLGNAVKFTQQGEIVVRVEQGGSSDEVRISVSDTGIGISRAWLPNLFEPFRQVEEGADRRFGGSGLGLAIVRQLVEAMGGHVSVHSEQGKGSQVEITLPLPQALTAAAEPSALQQRVGYFEPHETSAEALHALLLRTGCEARRCRDASELRAWCADHVDAAKLSWFLVCTDTPQTPELLEQAVDLLNPQRVIGMSNAESFDVDQARERRHLARKMIKPVMRAALVSQMTVSAPALKPLSSPASQRETTSVDLLPSLAHVLVVEDDALNQTIVCPMLRHAGYRVSAVSGGQSALDTLREQSFDVVLMDWQMPDMDGVEATRRLRAGAAARNVPVVALTANAFAEDRETCLAAGMNDFLTKPVLAASLTSAIERWTKRAVGGKFEGKPQ